MRRLSRWIILAAFSVGLCVELSQRWRAALGFIGLLVSCFGALSSGLGATPALHGPRAPDLHEAVVVETFEELTPLEAAALVGVLHEYRIVPRTGEWSWVESLELHAAMDLVARVTGLPRERIQRLYRNRWRELRMTTAPRLRAALEAHDLVERLCRFPEWA